MKVMMSAVAVALALSTLTAAAETVKPQITVPSAQNSGAGIAGYPGTKSGPVVRSGLAGGTKQYDLAVVEQDPANIRGLPGSKSGPSAHQLPHGGM
jgi:opacity protein-like surface antigen